MKFQLSYAGAPLDYPTLGFTADADGAILDGTLFDPDLTIPPDARWSVYGGGSAETDITRYADPSPEYLNPVPETTAGWLLAYDADENRATFQDPADLIETGAWATPLSAATDARIAADVADPEGVIPSAFVPQVAGKVDPDFFPDETTPAGGASLFEGVTIHSQVAVGVDTGGSVITINRTGGTFKIGHTSGTNRQLPPGVNLNDENLRRTGIIPAGSSLYGLFKDETTGLTSLWSVVKSPADQAWTQKSLTLNGTAATGFNRVLAFTGTHFLVGEYGDPVGGPKIYRAGNADGTWTTVWSDAATRHIHAIEVDPFNTGHVYATTGDGTATARLLKSTDHGATWSTVYSGDAMFQAVQISFTERYIWLAADGDYDLTIVVDRATMTPKVATPNFHGYLPIPGGKVGDQFHAQAYNGAWDSVTKRFYFISMYDSSLADKRFGLFYIDEPGGMTHLLAPLPRTFLPGAIHFTTITTNRYLWVGNAYLSLAQAPKRIITKASGEATIDDTASTEVVTHGLSSTPLVVTVDRRTDEDVWVSARDATTFTLSRTGTSGALTVGWRAELGRD